MSHSSRTKAPKNYVVAAICFTLISSSVLQAADVPLGQSLPSNRSEVSEVGQSKVENLIQYGSPAFSALDFSDNATLVYGLPKSNGGTITIVGEMESRRMLEELRAKLDKLSSEVQAISQGSKLRVLRAWVNPKGTLSPDDALHAEGRALDLRLEDGDGGPLDALLPQLGGKAHDLGFDWVAHKEATTNDAGEVIYPVHIHVSIKLPVNRDLVSGHIALQSPATIIDQAKDHLGKLVDLTDSRILDEFITKYRETDSGRAAMAVRYKLLRDKGKAFFDAVGENTIQDLPEGDRSARRTQCIQLANEYNSFISVHQGTNGAYVAAIELLQLRRVLNEPQGYLDFIGRYPTLPETQLAIDSLYQVEAESVLAADPGKSLEACDEFLQSYPNALQWDVIAAYATKLAIEQYGSLDASSASVEEKRRSSSVLRGRAVSVYEELRKLRRLDGNSESAAVKDVYTDVGRARYLLHQIDRVERVLNHHYRNTEAYRQLFQLQLDWEANDQLGRISRQLARIHDAIQANHAELIAEFQTQFKLTREEIKAGFESVSAELEAGNIALARQLSSLEENLDRHFAELNSNLGVLHRDLAVANQRLEQIVVNTQETKVAAAQIFQELKTTHRRVSELVKQTNGVVTAIEALDQTITEQIGEIKAAVGAMDERESSFTIDLGKIVCGGWKVARERAQTATASIRKEVSNITRENVERFARDPLGGVRDALKRGESSVRVEAGRAVEQLKKEEGFQLLQRALLGLGESTLLEKGPPPIECHTVPGSNPVYYVNGMTVPRDFAMFEAQKLGEHLNRTAFLIHNPTEISRFGEIAGLEADSREAILDRAWPATIWNLGVLQALAGQVVQHNATTRHVSHFFFHSNDRVDIVCHSQGTMIVRNALLSCKILGKDMSNIHVVMAGSPLGDSEIFPKPGKIEVKKKEHDPVVETFAFQGVFENKQNRAKHDFVKQYVEMISDADF
jgi:hypothetical protein